jgi:RHS repeat-associated protein
MNEKARQRASTRPPQRVKYGYDRASNRQWRQNTVAGTGQDEFYTYDGLEQVKTLKRGTLTGSPPIGIGGTPSWEEDWNYDPTGNWRGSSTAYLTKVNGSTTLNQNREHNVANEITDITRTTGTNWPVPTHDEAGNMTKVPRPLSLGNGFDLKWDAWNRLVEVKNTGGSVVATYGYDGAHRRVTKVAGGNTRHYYYSDRWQVVEERLNALTTADKRFVWGVRSIDDLVLRNHGATRHYALSDAMGSVTAIVSTAGTVQERYGYDGFGQPRYLDASFGSRANSSYTWETLFDGYRYDPESGLYQVRYRYLHPRLGRWVSRDPIGEVGGVNLSGYVNNAVTGHVDDSGRESASTSPFELRNMAQRSLPMARNSVSTKRPPRRPPPKPEHPGGGHCPENRPPVNACRTSSCTTRQMCIRRTPSMAVGIALLITRRGILQVVVPSR